MRECIACQGVPSHTRRVNEDIAGDARQAVVPAGDTDLPFTVPRPRRRFRGWCPIIRRNESDSYHRIEQSIHDQRRGGGEAGDEQVGGFCGQVLARHG